MFILVKLENWYVDGALNKLYGNRGVGVLTLRLQNNLNESTLTNVTNRKTNIESLKEVPLLQGFLQPVNVHRHLYKQLKKLELSLAYNTDPDLFGSMVYS
jgi:hypothetical protein